MIKSRKSLNVVRILAFSLLLSAAPLAFGSDYEGVKVTPLKKTTTTTTGKKVAYPKTDTPEVTAVLVEIPVNGETGWHLHPVPVYAYVLSGELAVEIEKGKDFSFKEGDALVEVVNEAHNGRNTGKEPVKLVVFYTGVEGSPNTVKAAHTRP
jgi:quercetin dioxygenase-like cupin family protein